MSATPLRMMQKSEFINDRPEEVLKSLRELLETGIIRQKELEKFTGFSAATISQVLNDKYEGDTEKIHLRLISFYRSWIAKNTIVSTTIVDEIHALMTLAWRRKCIVRINGRFGGGKTKAAQLFCVKNDYAVFVPLSNSESPVSILHRIGEAIGISNLTGSVQDKLKTIVRALKRNPKMLVIDEADELKKNTLATLRYLWDENEEYCSIILITTSRFDSLITHPDLGYLQSRIAITKEIADFSKDEVKKIIDKWDHKLNTETINRLYLWMIDNFAGRSLVHLMMTAHDFMLMNGKKKIDDDCIEEALTYQSTRKK